ncbi:MAG: DUF305 domain-containing protein [bacterium]|nr:DUF305 domain-containing protein [bacterium]
MNTNNKIIAFTAGALIIGLIVGFYLGKKPETSQINEMSHRMSDGSLMNSKGMSMNELMEGMNRDLVGKTGDEFDRAFLNEMIVHHEGAIGMAELALSNSKHQEVKDLAKNIIRAQESEISQMKNWLKAWYNSSI